VVEPRATASLDVTLMQKPATASVALRGNSIVAKSIKFVGNSTDLDPAAAEAVAELADLLLTRTDLQVRIQGYGDDAVALSRALLIKQRLVDAGVPDTRLEAVGGGVGKVNITVVQ
jgi:outer membrane protein OmpA-like peptidoglycan-associated protein